MVNYTQDLLLSCDMGRRPCRQEGQVGSRNLRQHITYRGVECSEDMVNLKEHETSVQVVRNNDETYCYRTG